MNTSWGTSERVYDGALTIQSTFSPIDEGMSQYPRRMKQYARQKPITMPTHVTGVIALTKRRNTSSGSEAKQVTHSIDSFKDSSRIFLLTEAAPFHDFRINPATAQHYKDSKVNLMFADGHAKSMAVDASWNGGVDHHWPRRVSQLIPPDWWTTDGTEGLMDIDP